MKLYLYKDETIKMKYELNTATWNMKLHTVRVYPLFS